jgi:hypothetical protein
MDATIKRTRRKDSNAEARDRRMLEAISTTPPQSRQAARKIEKKLFLANFAPLREVFSSLTIFLRWALVSFRAKATEERIWKRHFDIHHRIDQA